MQSSALASSNAAGWSGKIPLVALALTCAVLAPGKDARAQQSVRPSLAEPATPNTFFQLPPFPGNTQPPKPPTVETPSESGPDPGAAAVPPFRLRGISVEGAVTISAETVVASYNNRIGTIVEIKDVVAIANAITAAYRGAGFHLSRAIIPPQDIRDGVIRIAVIEGSIDEVVVQGVDDNDRFGVRALLRPVSAERPSKLATLERQLLLINQTPGVRVADTAMQEIGSATGRFRLLVRVQTWPVYWAQGIDNFGSASAGPIQAFTTLSFASALVRGDSLTASASTVPEEPSALAFGRLIYDVPVDDSGTRLGFSALQSVVRPTDPRRFLKDATHTTTYELRGSILPLQTRTSALRLSAAFAMSEVSESITLGTIYHDYIRVLSFGLDYRAKDDFKGWNYLLITLRQGLDVANAVRTDDPLNSRWEAGGDFTVVDLAYTRLQQITDAWSVKLSTSAQFSNDTLLLSQQYYLGSAGFGPGYYTGDNGFGGSLELRFDQQTNLALLKGYQLYGFVDGGTVWNVHNSDGTRASLASAGAGARFFLNEQLQTGVAVAFPVHNSFDNGLLSDVRVLFHVANAFRMCPRTPGLLC